MSEGTRKEGIALVTPGSQGTLPRLITLQEAAADLGLSVSTLRQAMWSGELAVVRLGRLVRIDRRDLEAWLERNKTRGPTI